MNVWEWITATTTGESLFTTLGLGVLATLFATNRIITRGQHLDRIADLVKHHERELIEKDARIADVQMSRDGWKAVALKERDLRDTATNEIATSATAALTDVKHVLESLDEAIGGDR